MLGRHALAEKASFIWRKVFSCTAYSSYLGRANFSYIFLQNVAKLQHGETKRWRLLEGRPAYQDHSFSMVS